MARENGIQVMGFSNLASSSYVEIGGATADESPLNLQEVKDIAQAHSKTPAQILLRWGVQRGTVIIPKSSKIERIQENISLFDFNLS
jgi:D-xylose reductase